MVGLKLSVLFSKPLIVLLVHVGIVRGYVSINLMSTQNETIVYENYTYNSFFDGSFSNSAGFYLTGYLHELSPEGSCYEVSPIISKTNSSDDWFALFSSYPSCFNDAVDNVDKAGYELILIADYAATSNSSAPSVGLYALPIVVISKEYADYLKEHALSDFSDPDVLADINTNNTIFFLAVAIILIIVVTLSFGLVIIYGVFKCGSGDGLSNRDHNTYQRLSEGTSRVQHRQWTRLMKQLPSSPYARQSLTAESCAICCNELKSGDSVRLLPCGHNTFHTDCLDDWLKYRRTCPLCRHDVTKKKVEVPPDTGSDNCEETDSNIPLMSGVQDLGYTSTSTTAV